MLGLGGAWVVLSRVGRWVGYRHFLTQPRAMTLPTVFYSRYLRHLPYPTTSYRTPPLLYTTQFHHSIQWRIQRESNYPFSTNHIIFMGIFEKSCVK